MMTRCSFVLVPLTAIALLAAPRAARADDCRSQWQKLGDVFRKLSPYAAKEICKTVADGDQAAAQKCVDDYERKKAEVEKIVGEYNTDAGSEKIGPRGLGWGAWYTGNLKAERTFVGVPATSDTAKLTFTAAGGKSAAAYTVSVCWLDPTTGTYPKMPVSKTFTTNSGSWTTSFTGVANLRPIVYLRNSKVTLNGHDYRVNMTLGGEPASIVKARAILAH